MNENFSALFEVFARHAKPDSVINECGMITPELQDAIEIGRKAREELTADDWERKWDAFYALSSGAFLHYLPSMLACTFGDTSGRWLVTSSLLNVLDRSPVAEYWDQFLLDRFFGLTDGEYSAITEWILSLSDSNGADEDSIVRAYETIELLRGESKKARDRG